LFPQKHRFDGLQLPSVVGRNKSLKKRLLIRLGHRSGSWCCAMVLTGSEELNHPELKRNYPMILVPSGAQRLEDVQ